MKKETLTLSAGIPLMILLICGCANINLRKGNQQFNSLAYGNAIKYFEKAQPGKFKIEDQERLAECYRRVNNYAKAEEAYKKAAAMKGAKAETHFYLGKILMENGKYEEAEKELKIYSGLVPTSSLSTSLSSSCKKVQELKGDSELYKITPVKIPVVSVAFSQVPYKNGLVFTAYQEEKNDKKDPWTGQPFYNLYYSEKTDTCWTEPYQLHGDLNKEYHEGAAIFNKKGNIVYFTRSNYFRNGLKKNSANESNLKIFRGELVNGKWTNLFELPFNSDDYSCGQPALSTDDKTLYFISDMPGGKGGTDIYYCYVLGDGFTTPQNLGDVVNTSGNEMFPYFNAEDNSLYFSSEGNVNLGGLDIFKTKMKNTQWTQPENLGYPINSSKDDFSYIPFPGNKGAYFSSNRDSIDQIYQVDKIDPVFTLSGTVTLKDENTPIPNAKLFVKSADGTQNTIIETDSAGIYKIAIAQNLKYNFTVSHEDFSTEEAEMVIPPTRHSKNFTKNFELKNSLPAFTLTGIVTVKGTNQPITNAKLKIKNIEKYDQVLFTDNDGRYSIDICQNSLYGINVTKDGFFASNDQIEIPARKHSETFTKNIEIEEIVLDKAIVMDNIYYDVNKANIRTDAAIELNKLVKLLTENPNITIELGSHTDSRASDPYNLKLSQKRADSAVKYIISKGIKANRIIAKGYGETKLLTPCGNGVDCPEEEHQKNRRTEFKVLKIKRTDIIAFSKK